MTSEEFDSKYRVLKQIAGGHWRTFTAEQRATGRAVLVHFGDQAGLGREPGNQELTEQLAPRDRAKVLDTMTVGGSLVCVTEVLEGFVTFESWLRSKSAPGHDPIPPTAPASPNLHGEFTQLFKPSVELPPSPRATPPAFEVGPAKPAPASERVAGPPPAGGGLTDLFRAPAAPLPTPRPAPAPPAPRADPIAPSPRDEPPTRHEPPAPPPLRVVGLRFGSGREGLPPPAKPNFGGSFEAPPPAPPPLEPRLPQEGSPPPLRPNFGGSFEAPPPVHPPLEPRLPQLFAADPGPPRMPPAPQPIWNGPSEFTRQLERRPGLSNELPAVIPAPEPDRPPEKKSYVPLLLALNLIVIIATGLIVYFALKRR